MARTIQTFKYTLTPSSGSASYTITAPVFSPLTRAGGYIEQVLVKAHHPDDEFDFKITDSDDFVIYDKTGAVGKINDTVRIPARGNYTIAIANATRDADHSVKILLKEDW